MTTSTTRRRTVLAGVLLTMGMLVAPPPGEVRTSCAEDASPPAPPDVPTKPAPAPTRTTPSRADLALRLVALEETLRDRPAAFATRRRATAQAVSKATMMFFGGAFGPAMDALGEATAELRGERWDPTTAALSRLRVQTAPVTILGADGQARVEVRLVPLGAPPAADLPVAITAAWAVDERNLAARDGKVRYAPTKPLEAWIAAPLPVPPTDRAKSKPGRRGIAVRIETLFETVESPTGSSEWPPEAVVVVRTDVAIVAADTPARFVAAKASLAATTKAVDGTPPGVRPTLERLARRIEDALAGRVGDVVPDVADELRRLEEGVAGLAEAAKTGKAYVPGRAALFGDSHRTTVDGRAYRLYVPSEAAGDPSGPMPLVVALHGAGGNEDMYFEAYGAGEALALAKARGWVLAAPDVASDAVAVAQDVRSLLDIDAKRVYLTGHSMGAVAAWSAAAARPDLWAAVAPVSGGGLSIPRAAEGLPPPPPVLVVAGEIDFGRGMAEATAKRAKDSGLAVEVRVLPDLDHLLVVAASLPGVFTWFEAHPKP